MDSTYLLEITWDDIREKFKTLNPALCNIIDQLSPSKKYTLFKARYLFGDEIIKKGLLYLPCDNALKSIRNDDIDAVVKSKLGYNLGTNPVSMILNNSTEIFMLMGSHTIPLYGLITPGKIFSTSRVLSNHQPFTPPFLWDMTAGARSIFMLPKISEGIGHNKIKHQFNIDLPAPKSLLDHWAIFREIVRSDKNSCKWFTEILFFTDNWFKHLNDKAWRDFKLYLLQSAWDSSEFWRSQFIWDLVFCIIQKNKNLKPNPYVADTVKHILAMGVGAASGFAPAIDNIAAPCAELEKIYSEVYQIKDYQPIIMHPHTFSLKENRSAYYSLEYPNTLEFSPKSKRTSNKITDLKEIQYILSKYFAEINNGTLNINGTPFQDLINTVRFDFFHTRNNNDAIKDSSKIPIEDKNMRPLYAKANDKIFPSNSSFVRGCIRLTKK